MHHPDRADAGQPRDAVDADLAPRTLPTGWAATVASTSAAKSAIGMAEMLAHEIKNPLAGISGAAQLLAMNLRR